QTSIAAVARGDRVQLGGGLRQVMCGHWAEMEDVTSLDKVHACANDCLGQGWGGWVGSLDRLKMEERESRPDRCTRGTGVQYFVTEK
ncbi:hypothetical protein BaRGS_00012285, partial [Batillaria attramentaria]